MSSYGAKDINVRLDSLSGKEHSPEKNERIRFLIGIIQVRFVFHPCIEIRCHQVITFFFCKNKRIK